MEKSSIRRRIRRPTMAVDSTIGQRIQETRLLRALLQEDVARQIGVSVGVLSRIEQGHQTISAERLAAVSRLFGVSADYLLGLRNDKHSRMHGA